MTSNACPTCGKMVQYDDHHIGNVVTCPHCRADIQATGISNPNLIGCPSCDHGVSKQAVACPKCGAPLAAPAKAASKSISTGTGCGIILAVFALIFGGAFLIALFNPSPRFDAYYSAKQFIQREYPGAKEFSDEPRSRVEINGDVATVAIEVTGVNSFNAPIRKVFVVVMKRSGDRWEKVSLTQ